MKQIFATIFFTFNRRPSFHFYEQLSVGTIKFIFLLYFATGATHSLMTTIFSLQLFSSADWLAKLAFHCDMVCFHNDAHRSHYYYYSLSLSFSHSTVTLTNSALMLLPNALQYSVSICKKYVQLVHSIIFQIHTINTLPIGFTDIVKLLPITISHLSMDVIMSNINVFGSFHWWMHFYSSSFRQ